MEFRNIVIGRDMYGESLKVTPIGEIDYEYLMRRNSRYRYDKSMSNNSNNFDSRGLSYDLSGASREGEADKNAKRQLIELMFTMIATCHECIPNSKGEFEGPSPDEVALVKAAHSIGFKFVSN
jgi:magnesium-transporting ATPase (P-type)